MRVIFYITTCFGRHDITIRQIDGDGICTILHFAVVVGCKCQIESECITAAFGKKRISHGRRQVLHSQPDLLIKRILFWVGTGFCAVGVFLFGLFCIILGNNRFVLGHKFLIRRIIIIFCKTLLLRKQDTYRISYTRRTGYKFVFRVGNTDFRTRAEQFSFYTFDIFFTNIYILITHTMLLS